MVFLPRRLASLLRVAPAGTILPPATGNVSSTAGLIQNAGWLVLERGIRFGLVFVTSVVVLRYLGPAEAGRLGNALALAAILAGLCDLGLDAIIRVEVINRPGEQGVILATAAGLRLMLLPLAWAGYALFLARESASLTNPGLLYGVGVTLAMPVVLTLDSWFQSQTQARYSVLAQTGGLVAGAALRLLGAALGAPLAWFGWVAGLELMLSALLLLRFYHATTPMPAWRFYWPAALHLIGRAWPLALTNIAILVYTRIDIVLLSWWRGEHETGIYAAAVRLTEFGYILPMILVNTFFPLLARRFNECHDAFLHLLRRLLVVAAWAGVGTALVFSVGAPLIVRTLYGPAYAPTANVLALAGWNAVFAGLGALRAQWLVLHDLQRYGLYYVGMGAALNLTLNAFLIPGFGATGAAIASLTTQAFIVFIAPLFFAPTRSSVALLLQSFLFVGWRRTAAASSP
ncbi:flippase [Opitutus sp. ER46]|uniref:flippase n=1 Tax=Opitutus sp. ER46 TaxID=2161864 RepID=UPI000D309CC7|nr:flippase [Opitutus sp. ER46]PTX95551.1 hypothetical protein DB354_09010 [Opitutus sp. ER46]